MMTPMTDSRPTPDWRPLALSLAVLTAVYAVVYRLAPFDMRGYLLWPFGAWALYSGARLTARVAFPLTIGVFALTDVILYVGNAVPPNYIFYLCLAVTVVAGRGLLARSQAGQNNLEAAGATIQLAVETIDAVVTRIPDPALRETFLAWSRVMRCMVSLPLDRGWRRPRANATGPTCRGVARRGAGAGRRRPRPRA